MYSHMKWKILDHLCKECGGRILQCVAGGGPTGGGNPIFKCAQCPAITSSMGPSALCWCGFEMRGQRTHAYVCLPFSIIKENPAYKNMFSRCGCNPDSKSAEVGIVLTDDLLKMREETVNADR